MRSHLINGSWYFLGDLEVPFFVYPVKDNPSEEVYGTGNVNYDYEDNECIDFLVHLCYDNRIPRYALFVIANET